MARALFIGALALALSQYFAGCIFLALLRINVREASPLTVARYAFYYGAIGRIQQRLWWSSAAGIGLALLPTMVLLAPPRRSLHGDARFARGHEVRRAGLRGDFGIILGEYRGRYLMLAGQQGVALAAPPRAGKGVGCVIPNALSWPDSLVCLDIKRENWVRTAGYRASCGQQCFLFDPFSPEGHTARWNPFTYVSADSDRRLNDLQRIAEMLYPDPPNVDPFWTASARSLFLGIALYLFESPSIKPTIGEVLRQGMASDDEGFGQHWKRIITGRNSGRYPLSPQCVRALYDVIDLAPVTASSIRKTFTSRLDLWLNPILDAATSESDFDLRRLRCEPMSIYVAVSPDDLHRLRPVLNLFFQQAIGLQTRELPEHNPALKHQVMMLLDEFTALGRIPIIAEAISFLPGYNVRVVLVIQTPAQLREVYGVHAAEILLKALAARIVFAPKDQTDAREISEELGYTTIKVRSISKPLFDLFAGKGVRSRSESVSEQRRALLLPQEVKALGQDEALVFYEGLRPIRCRKIRYFDDRAFRERLLPPPVSAGRRHLSDDGPPPTSEVEPSSVEVAASDANDIKGMPSPVEETIVRTGDARDIERIESLSAEDFAADLSQVELPQHEGPMSNEELQRAVASFLDSLQRE